MTEKDRSKDIATFRFGVIADFVNGARLQYGERAKLLADKSARSYEIPFSTRTTVSRSTILLWVKHYLSRGNCIEALYPRVRSDKGTYRNLDSTVRLGILSILKEEPDLTVPTIIKKLRQKKIIGPDEKLHKPTIYRFIGREVAQTPNTGAEDRRAFEASWPNEIWQCDVMHGPRIRIDGVWKKTYLCAIMDDHSRMIVHAAFYLSETYAMLKACLQEAVMRRGIPQKFYVDNGACFSTGNLAYTAAALGIVLIHSRPYTPQGRGKIERWFRTVRESFLPFCAKGITLPDMNEALGAWIDEYHGTEHGTTRMKPIDRYRANLECVRPAPANLIDYFRVVEERKVRKDRTFQLKGLIFEAPIILIDKKVECLFHEEQPDDVEVRWNNLSYGRVRLLDRSVNARIGREWGSAHAGGRETMPAIESEIQRGELFGVSPSEEVDDETL